MSYKATRMELSELTADRISNVPTNAIEHILALLPTKEAVRTSIFARSWRHYWRSIPELVFDGSSFAPLPDMDDANLPNESKLLANIYESVLRHDGRITKFELAIPGLRDCPEIEKLILHLPSKGLEELALRFSVGRAKMHSSLFSAFNLKVLKLQNCSFTAPSSFVGFGKLAILELEGVSMPEDFLPKFLPECSVLEELRVSNCSPQRPLLLLQSLKVVFFHSPGLLDLNHAPLLSVLSLLDKCVYRYENSSLVALFASCPALKQLTFGISSLLHPAEGNAASKLSTTLHQLKVLEVSRLRLDSLQQARFLLRLITSSPNLQTFTIGIDTNNNAQPPSEVIDSLQKLLEAESQLGVSCLQHLEELNIQECRGAQVELDLVRFVLATAPRLRRFSIKHAVNLPSEVVLKFMNEVALYERASKEAEIK